MTKVFFDCAVSLDGYFAGENRSPENPMGGVSPLIHAWMMRQKAFWEHLKMEGGEEIGTDGELIRQVFARAGAYIMGKRMFEEGEVVWPEDLFKADVYVLTHEQRKPWVQKGSTTFYFINDGIESALDKARKAANGKDVRIQGGANTIQQYLKAGLIDEFTIHLAPVILGRGIRLFEGLEKDSYELKISGVETSDLTTHLSYTLAPK